MFWKTPRTFGRNLWRITKRNPWTVLVKRLLELKESVFKILYLVSTEILHLLLKSWRNPKKFQLNCRRKFLRNISGVIYKFEDIILDVSSEDIWRNIRKDTTGTPERICGISGGIPLRISKSYNVGTS